MSGETTSYRALIDARQWLANKFKVGFGTDTAQDIARDMLYHLDTIEKAVRLERLEMVSAVRELREGMCPHCDLQDQCAEGEDGIPTACNAMTRVRNFLETYGEQDKKENKDEDECPF